jgi:hypothetical protein
MRLGLLKSARKSFAKAKSLLNGMPSGGLDDNLAALDEHEIFAESIGHNPTTMYEEYSVQREGEEGGSSFAEDEGDYDDDGYGGYDGGEDQDGGEEDDLSAVEALTSEAIFLAESGDVMGSLPLFQSAADQNPDHSKAWENLGVTQVRPIDPLNPLLLVH